MHPGHLAGRERAAGFPRIDRLYLDLPKGGLTVGELLNYLDRHGAIAPTARIAQGAEADDALITWRSGPSVSDVWRDLKKNRVSDAAVDQQTA